MARDANCSSEPMLDLPTLVDILHYRARKQPRQLAYTFLLDGEGKEARMDYGTLDRKVRAIAAMLQAEAGPGERALLLYPPGLDFVAAFLACLYSDILPVPLYPPHPARLKRSISSLSGICKNAEPSLALTITSTIAWGDMISAKAPEFGAMKWLTTDDVSDELCDRWQHPDIGGETPAFLQYTSGSTSMPKGVIVSHGNLLHNLLIIQKYLVQSPDSLSVSWLPPYHDMGLIGGILEPLYGGFPVVLMSPFAFLESPYRWLHAISRFKGTISPAPNFAYDLCVKYISPDQRRALDLTSWDLAFNGAEKVNPETLDRFADYFESCGFRREAFFPCYGLAEATLIVSGGLKQSLPVVQQFSASALEQNHITKSPDKIDTLQTLVGCGQATIGQTIIIVDPDTLMRCDPDQVGEIWVSGPCVAGGYWNNQEETESTFQAHLSDAGEGPFLRTGDLGFMCEGELFVTGRLKDLIIIRGKNCHPEDIESTVCQNHPFIKPTCCAAFSVDVDGQERLVVLAETDRHFFKKKSSPDMDALIKSIRSTVSRHHDLRAYDIILLKPNSISKTTSGKIKRHACRELYLSNDLNVWAV